MKNQIFRLQEKSNLLLYQRQNWREFPPLTKFFIVDDGTGARKHYQDYNTLKQAQTAFKTLTQ